VNSSPESVTSTTLLVRLRQSPADEAAWAEFVARYGHRIHGWCREWGLQESDAQDVTQTVLLKLVRAVQTFRYDPAQKFRAWLKTVTHHAWQDLVRGRRRLAAGGTGSADDPLQSLAARDDLAARVEAAYEQDLLNQALDRVQARVQPKTWDAFRLTAFDGLSGTEVAAQLGMPVTSVFKAKSNVQKLLEAEVHYLEGGEPWRTRARPRPT
jgi:RNA polymerase sigma factor (sigma-70 family)